MIWDLPMVAPYPGLGAAYVGEKFVLRDRR